MEQSNVIKNAYIEISHAPQENTDLWPENQFATLTVEIEDIPAITDEQHIVFSVDISGSMSDICNDGRTKMQHIAHTTRNIIDVFSDDKTANITVEIHGFDDKLETIVAPTKCTDESRLLMQTAITAKLRPRDSTNIEIALKNAKQSLQSINYRKTHIFMTDGQVTAGEKNVEALKECVDETCPNIFVGFGMDHDAYLLQTLATNGSYYYIDHVETAGLAYGEITHGIMYQALENTTITVINGEIYDYRTNTWSNELQIPSLVGEAKKTYHLRSATPSLLKATISGTNVQTKSPIQEDVDVLPELLGSPPNDFTKYLYRQRTLELIYEANELQKTENKNARNRSTPYSRTSFANILDKLANFLKNMTEYMESKNLTDDDFMKTLCEDISVTTDSLKSCGANIGIAYSAGRARSNGAQGCYQPTFRRMNAGEFYDFNQPPPMLNRSNTTSRQMTVMQTLSQRSDDTTQEDLPIPPPFPEMTPLPRQLTRSLTQPVDSE
jgi:hypothetical protein